MTVWLAIVEPDAEASRLMAWVWLSFLLSFISLVSCHFQSDGLLTAFFRGQFPVLRGLYPCFRPGSIETTGNDHGGLAGRPSESPVRLVTIPESSDRVGKQ
jgi:hypothetical protein